MPDMNHGGDGHHGGGGFFPFRRQVYALQYYIPQTTYVAGMYRVYYSYNFGGTVLNSYIDINSADSNDFGIISKKAIDQLSAQGKENASIYRIEALRNTTYAGAYGYPYASRTILY